MINDYFSELAEKHGFLSIQIDGSEKYDQKTLDIIYNNRENLDHIVAEVKNIYKKRGATDKEIQERDIIFSKTYDD